MSNAVQYGNYLLLERINVGGMAEVFKAKTFGIEGFERLVAVKRILPSIASDSDFVTMFVDEAKIAVQLQHPNIAQVFDLGKVEDSYFIAMEYVAGADLRVILDEARRERCRVPLDLAVYIISKVCEGLDYAHNKRNEKDKPLNLVHRDVSPQNILISFDGEIKIIDFGIAKAVGKVGETQSGILKGKFGYMSPEQVRGLPLDRRSDIFTIGICLYELLTGQRLFLGHSDFSTLEKVRNVEVLPPTYHVPGIPEELERITLKALAKNLEDRYQSVAELRDDLKAAVQISPQAAHDLGLYMRKRLGSSSQVGSFSAAGKGALAAAAIDFEPARGRGIRRTPPPPPPRHDDNGWSPPCEGTRPSSTATRGEPAAAKGRGKAPLTRRDRSLALPSRSDSVASQGAAADHGVRARRKSREVPTPSVGRGPRSEASSFARSGRVDVGNALPSTEAHELTTRVYDRPSLSDGPKARSSWLPPASGWRTPAEAPKPSWASGPAHVGPPRRLPTWPGAHEGRSGAWRYGAGSAYSQATLGGYFDRRSAQATGAAKRMEPSASMQSSTQAVAYARRRRSRSSSSTEDSSVRRIRRRDAADTVSRRPAWSDRSMVTETRLFPSSVQARRWLWGAALVASAGLLAWLLWLGLRDQTGVLKLVTHPSDATVFFDHQPILATASPFLIRDVAPEREHIVTVDKEGYRTWSRRIRLEARQTLVLPPVHLVKDPQGQRGPTPDPAAATKSDSGFVLTSNPTGAQVTLNGQVLGEKTPLRITDLEPGFVAVRLESGPEFEPWSGRLEVQEGRIIRLPRIDLKPRSLDLSISTQPSGAQVTLVQGAQRRELGTSPLRTLIQGGEGDLQLMISRKGYLPWQQSLAFPPDQDRLEVEASLQADPQAKASKRPSRRKKVSPDAYNRVEAAASGSSSSADTGTLRINTRPWSQVFVDGELVGNTPQLNLAVPPGKHEIELVNPDFDLRKQLSVIVEAGKTITKILDLAQTDSQ